MAPLVTVDTELNKQLVVERVSNSKVLRRRDGDTAKTLPGEPLLELASDRLVPRLRELYLTPELDRMAPYFRFIVTPESKHIFPVHFQSARGRQVYVNENQNLHLVWHQDQIFIKPIAPYLLSAAFWEWITETDDEVFRAAAGFLRTYCYLIKSEADFRLAGDDKLPLMPRTEPAAGTTDDFEKFARFINQFASLGDGDVSQRYAHAGELRLSRLNWLTRLLGVKFTFFHVRGEWSAFFMDMLAPLVAVFAIVSILLSAMQVSLAVETLSIQASSERFISVCYWFSIVTLIITGLISAALVIFVLSVYVYQQIFSYRYLERKKANREKIQSGVAA